MESIWSLIVHAAASVPLAIDLLRTAGIYQSDGLIGVAMLAVANNIGEDKVVLWMTTGLCVYTAIVVGYALQGRHVLALHDVLGIHVLWAILVPVLLGLMWQLEVEKASLYLTVIGCVTVAVLGATPSETRLANVAAELFFLILLALLWTTSKTLTLLLPMSDTTRLSMVFAVGLGMRPQGSIWRLHLLLMWEINRLRLALECRLRYLSASSVTWMTASRCASVPFLPDEIWRSAKIGGVFLITVAVLMLCTRIRNQIRIRHRHDMARASLV
ncbi:hypothetical protein EJ04DRAFT_568691 [Polyplosphaeria fusca]|uniref:Uncharacterized protein n=1 Tax=Polyplosphaeria fusca TaxID=682080 RepID=A0A9P4QL52_9PLEO|nr:hypothetical protein EJ04DRAFT_568691 [Polyplosphaeria fusca]